MTEIEMVRLIAGEGVQSWKRVDMRFQRGFVM